MRYHPRSSKHGDFLAQSFLEDLLDQSPLLKRAAAQGKIAYALNYPIQVADAVDLPLETQKDLAWNIDLALGVPKPVPAGKVRKSKKRLLDPSVIQERKYPNLENIWMMVDAKGVMTEHGKARRNRQRDITALWAVMHTFIPESVVGAVLPVNIARRFKSPLREAETNHGTNIEQVVKDTLAIFRAVKRVDPDASSKVGIEGVGCFVIDYTNTEGATATLRTTPPAPGLDDPIRYENLVSSLARHLEKQFAAQLA